MSLTSERLVLVQGDMRDLQHSLPNYRGGFALCLLPVSSIVLVEPKRLLDLFGGVRASLTPGGSFCLDLSEQAEKNFPHAPDSPEILRLEAHGNRLFQLDRIQDQMIYRRFRFEFEDGCEFFIFLDTCTLTKRSNLRR